MSNNVINYNNELNSLSQTLEKTQLRIEALAKEAITLDKALDKNSKSYSETKQSLDAVNKSTQKLQAEEKELASIIKRTSSATAKANLAEKGSLKELEKQNIKLREARKQARIEAEKELGVVKKQNKLFSGLKGAVKSAITSFIAWGAAISGAIALFKKFGKSIISSSQNMSDALDRLKARTQATMDAIARSLTQVNTGYGKLSENIRKAREAANEYTLAQDELADTMRSIDIETAKVESEVYKLREIYTNTGVEAEKRLKAVLEANDKLLKLQKRRGETAKTAINEELKLITNTLNLNEEEKKYIEDFIVNYGKKEGLYYELLQKNNPLIEERARLEKIVSEGTYTDIDGMQNRTIAAQKAWTQIKVLNEGQLSQYNKIEEATNQIADAQRDRIGEALVNLYQQEKATQRLINETARQETAIRNSIKPIEEETKEYIKLEEIAPKSINIIKNSQIELNETIKQTDDYLLKEVSAYEIYAQKIADKNLEILQNEQLTQDEKANLILENNDFLLEKQIEYNELLLEQSNLTEKEKFDLHSQLTDLKIQKEKELTQRTNEENEKRKQDFLTYSDQINSISQAIFNYQTTLLDAELESLRAKNEAGLLSDKEYAKKEAQLQREKARKEKFAAIFEATINTASAIVEALPSVPLSILAGVLGGIQIATIAATPIPAFKTGVHDFKGGTAIFGEAGRELVNIPGHGVSLIEQPTIGYLPRGTDVIPNWETEKILKGGQNIDRWDDVINSNNRVENAIKNINISVNSTKINGSKWSQSVQKGNTTITLLNKYFK